MEETSEVKLAEDRIISSPELQEELSKHEPQQSFSTGYFHLDRMLNGCKEGDLVILSGLTGNGKTEFAVSLAKSFIEQNVNTLFFSYEISSQELLERFGTPMPVFYLPRIPKSKAPQWIEAKIQEAIDKYHTKVVFVDHLHYLVDEYTTRSKNTSEMLGQLCRDLKQMARRQRVVIFLLAHIRKIAATARPTMQDIKDSSGIIQEADTVLLIHRKGKRRSKKAVDDDVFASEEGIPVSNKSVLYVDKVRRRGGQLGNIDLVFEDGVFKEVMYP